MPSYKFVPVPEDGLKTDNVRDQIEDLSARDSQTKPRSGTIPESYAEVDGIYWFDYAQEKIEEFETLDGVETLPIPDKYSVVFLSDEYLAFEKCNQDIEKALLAAISGKFTDGYSLNPVEFEEETLRKVLDDADSILRLEVAPERREKPNKVSAKDTKLEETDFPEEHDADPFEKVKVELPDRSIDVGVSFDKDGVVILHTRSMEMHEQVRVLRLIAENVIDEYLDQDSFQTTLFGGDNQ